MELFSTSTEAKLEDSCMLSSQNIQTKIKKSISKNKSTSQYQSMSDVGKSSLKTFKVHQTLKPIEQKINCMVVKSKQWKRKKFASISCNNVTDIQVTDKLIIFNNLQVEAYYDDLEPQKIKDPSEEINRVSSISKNKNSRILELNLSSQFYNKQYTFKFLIDHFRKIPDPQYQNLYQSLQKYQTAVTSMYYRLHNLQKQIKKEESYYQQVLDQSKAAYSEVKEQALQYCLKLNENNKNNNNFYFYKIQRVNYQSKTNDLSQIGFSYDLLSILGLNEEKCEIFPFSFYNNLISITKQYNGQQRISTQIKLLEAMSNYDQEVTDINIILQTLDFLDLQCTAKVHFIYPSKIPCWMGKEDICAQIWRFSICNQLLEQTNQLRKQTNIQTEYSSSDNIEYCMTRDLFLNKFYPKLAFE